MKYENPYQDMRFHFPASGSTDIEEMCAEFNAEVASADPLRFYPRAEMGDGPEGHHTIFVRYFQELYDEGLTEEDDFSERAEDVIARIAQARNLEFTKRKLILPDRSYS